VISGGAPTTFGLAWLIATSSLALHVVDEATHDFLSWYNPRALRIRQALGGLPFPPTFTFVPWVFGLCVVVLVLASLTPAAYAGSSWIRPFGYALAAVHIAWCFPGA
jgi:ABC-type antimicrobial peptide transport system permease subunit